METIEKEVVVKKKIIQMTEDELENMKKEMFNKGISATLGYIAYSYNNYGLVLNLAFAVDFCNSLADFVCNESYMKNKNKLSLQDFVYRKFSCQKEKSML